MSTTNPTVAIKRHNQLQGAHRNKAANMGNDFDLWADDIEQMITQYYMPLLETLQQSTNPEDEELYIGMDKQYTARMAALQAARERMTECCAHLALAITPKNWSE